MYVHLQNDLHRAMQKSQSALTQQIIILGATVVCIVFTRWRHCLELFHIQLNVTSTAFYHAHRFETHITL